MQGLRLYKSEKLCSHNAVNALFESGKGSIAYPLRAVYRFRPAGDEQRQAAAQFLITVPKKKMRHAVGRVLLRRRIREAYRLNRCTLLHPALTATGVDIAFIYLSNDPAPYDVIETKMKTLLERIARDAQDYKTNNQQPDEKDS